MYSEFDVKRQIETIEGSEDTPIRKARRLITLSRDLRRFSHHLRHGAHILEGDEDGGAHERLQQTLNCLHRMHDEARLAAFRSLKSGTPERLGFAVVPEPTAQWSIN